MGQSPHKFALAAILLLSAVRPVASGSSRCMGIGADCRHHPNACCQTVPIISDPGDSGGHFSRRELLSAQQQPSVQPGAWCHELCGSYYVLNVQALYDYQWSHGGMLPHCSCTTDSNFLKRHDSRLEQWLDRHETFAHYQERVLRERMFYAKHNGSQYTVNLECVGVIGRNPVCAPDDWCERNPSCLGPYTGGFWSHMGKDMWGGVKDLGNMATHPVKTIDQHGKKTLHELTHPIETANGVLKDADRLVKLAVNHPALAAVAVAAGVATDGVADEVAAEAAQVGNDVVIPETDPDELEDKVKEDDPGSGEESGDEEPDEHPNQLKDEANKIPEQDRAELKDEVKEVECPPGLMLIQEPEGFVCREHLDDFYKKQVPDSDGSDDEPDVNNDDSDDDSDDEPKKKIYTQEDLKKLKRRLWVVGAGGVGGILGGGVGGILGDKIKNDN